MKAKVGDKVRVKPGEGCSGHFADGDILKITKIDSCDYLYFEKTGGWYPGRFELVSEPTLEEQIAATEDLLAALKKQQVAKMKEPILEVIAALAKDIVAGLDPTKDKGRMVSSSSVMSLHEKKLPKGYTVLIQIGVPK